MTLEYGEEKPPLGELAHYGVKGMKWGKRKAKPSALDIHTARIRQQSRINELNRVGDKLNLATGKQGDALAKKYAKMADEINNSPDRAVAHRMTRGEKAAMLIIAGPIGAAVIAQNSAQVRSIKKQQQNAKK